MTERRNITEATAFYSKFCRTRPTPTTLSSPTTPGEHSVTDLESSSATDAESSKGSASGPLAKKLGRGDGKFDGGFRFQGSGDMGIDAVKKLQMHYNINKACTECITEGVFHP